MTRSIILVLGFVVLAVGTAYMIGSKEQDERKAKSEEMAGEKSGTCEEVKSSTTESETMILEGYDIGDVATDFSLKNVDGEMVSLSDYVLAKGFVIVFTCNHCPYSVAYEDRLIELSKTTSNLGYPLIAINPNNPKTYESDSYENMVIRAEEKGFNFPYLEDKGQKIYPQYGATKTPHVYVLKKENKALVVKYIGAIDDNYSDAEAVKEKYVEDAVIALTKGDKVDPEITKAIGCSIKR